MEVGLIGCILFFFLHADREDRIPYHQTGHNGDAALLVGIVAAGQSGNSVLPMRRWPVTPSARRYGSLRLWLSPPLVKSQP
jgi:hypothetical protein